MAGGEKRGRQRWEEQERWGFARQVGGDRLEERKVGAEKVGAKVGESKKGECEKDGGW